MTGSTPGRRGRRQDTSFAALKEANYDGWLMIEAFSLAAPELAAATKIWQMYQRRTPRDAGSRVHEVRWENE
ncbi:MAG: hypothetical protein U0992_08475 [Planctomycetaceae bacterium]